MYGVTVLRDSSTVAYELGKCNLLKGDVTAREDLCFRTLLMLKRNLETIATAKPTDGKRGRPRLLKSIKDGGSLAATSEPKPACAYIPCV